MALGERFRSAGTRGIARFLSDHQDCDAGFDVRREDAPGSGKLLITCQGCGESVAYRAAQAEALAGLGLGGGTENGEAHQMGSTAIRRPVAPTGSVPTPPPASQAPAPEPSPGSIPSAEPPGPPARTGDPGRPPVPPALGSAAGEGRRFPSWLPTALIGGLIAAGLAMIAIGLMRSDDSDPEPEPAPPAAEQPPPEQPAPEQPAPEPGGASAEAAPEEPGDEVALSRETFAQRFALGLPPGWDQGREDGAVTLEAAGGVAAVRVFFESGERPTGELARAAAAFLADEHSGARVGAPRDTRLGGSRAARIEANYPAGEEIAVVLSGDGFAFLILSRVDRGASEQIEREAEAIVESFEPL